MRRYENGSSPRHHQQATSAFRVLSPGRQQLQYDVQTALHRPTPPPPPRAPEPYKLATPGRSQRKSAFAIIAEPPAPAAAQTGEQKSRPASPTGFPASGRVSPFRGRGFKGPPPRARSRPHTPPRGNHSSAHSSPRRSLSQIPRPSANNKVAPLSSSRDDLSSSARNNKSSPKFGRRAATTNNNRYTSSVGSKDQQQQQRNGQVKPAATTLKRPSAAVTSNGKLKQKAPGSGQEINNKLLRVPPKNPPTAAKRFVTANNNNNNNINNSNNNVNRINVAPRAAKHNGITATTSDSPPESPSRIPLRNGASSLSASREVLNKPAKHQNNNASHSNGYDDKDNANNKNEAQPPSDEKPDLGLVDLLKQSSAATGTQSVVNTTTTTAVQPLQIDAASILAEAELVAKLSSLEKKQKEQEAAAETTKKEQQTDEPAKSSSKSNPYTQTMIKHFGPNSTAAAEDKRPAATIVQVEPQKAPGESATPATDGKQTKEKTESSTVVAAPTKPAEETAKPAAAASASPSASAEKKSQLTTTTTSSNNVRSTKKSNNNITTSETLLQAQETLVVVGGSSEASPVSGSGSVRSTDTGVSLNTVRGGVSSAKEKSGLHVVKRAEEIETLSGNVVDGNGQRPLGADSPSSSGNNAAGNKAGTKWASLKSRLVKRLGCKKPASSSGNNAAAACWPKMRCLACRRDTKAAQLWPGRKAARGASTIQLTAPDSAAAAERSVKTRWDRFKDACRCLEWRRRRQRRRIQRLQVAPMETRNTSTTTTTPPAIVTASKCCSPVSIGALCRGLFSKCTCCGRRRASLQSERGSKRSKSVRAKHSLTGVTGPPLSEKTGPKLHETLVEHNSVMRGAIPCLPIPIAWFCLIFNVVVPGTGTVLSGLFNMCMGQPRFSATASPAARFGAFVVDLIVGVSQLFTVLFCLVGWGWSIWWGVTMVRLARKWKRYKESEAAANDPEAHRAGPETATLPAPGIAALRPTQAERPR